MHPKNLLILICACIGMLAATVRAETADNPNDSFLNAYTDFQTAARAEAEGNLKGALQKYKETARLLDQITSRWPNWEPTIVDYRRKRTAEAITKLSGKVSSDAAPVAAPPIDNGTIASAQPDEPKLPQESTPLLPPAEPAPPPRSNARKSKGEAPAPLPADPLRALEEERKRLRDENAKLTEENDRLQREKSDIEKQAKQAAAAAKEAKEKQQVLQDRADLMETKLAEARSKGKTDADAIKALESARDKARKQLSDLQIERDAAEELRQQNALRMANADKRAAILQSERDAAKKAAAEAATKIEQAQKLATTKVQDAENKMNAAIKERDTFRTKLMAVTSERDDALQQIQKFKESQKQVDQIVSDNTHLMAQLADAQKQIADFKTDGAQKDAIISDLKKEVGSVRQELANVKKQSAEYQVHMAELQGKLDDTQKNLAALKAENVAAATEKKKMLEENDTLRGIVMREMKEEARRVQTRKLMLDQMTKLDIKSTELLNQITYLSQPVIKLTAKERALFKKPQVEISDNEITLAAPKADDTETTAAATPPAPASTNVNEAGPAGQYRRREAFRRGPARE